MEVGTKLVALALLSFGYIGFIATSVSAYTAGASKPIILTWALGIILWIAGVIMLFQKE